jgi:hypothetical protein
VSSETEESARGWSVDVLREHLAIVRALDEKLEAERDRRYAEVNVEKEKALKIKETADLAALQLAREIQTYKDEKANELREQINSERGNYASKDDLANAVREIQATVKPLAEFVSAQTGRSGGLSTALGYLIGIAAVAVAVIAVVTR